MAAKRQRPHRPGWNAERFTELRKQFGEQTALAAAVGVGQNAVRKWETPGSYGPYAHILKTLILALAERLERDPIELLDELTTP